MKTAISVPDDVFKDVERAAKRLGLSRSEVFTRAVRSFLATQSAEAIRASYNEAYSGGEAAEDRTARAFRREATRRALLKVEW